jgi:DNA polymerase
VDARDRLRQYLEQRKELGEREFVLDTLSVEEALRLLGAPAEHPPRVANVPSESEARKAAAAAAESGDWRETLRSIGADKPRKPATRKSTGVDDVPEGSPGLAGQESAGEGKVGRFEMPRQAPPDVAAAGSSGSGSLAELRKGIVVGYPMADLTAGPLASLDSTDAIARVVASCTLCPLHATAKNPVPGEGNPHAGFVCVGEAPGATEDETGRPFVGQAGQLLTKILEAIAFKREDVFICNVLKHRPPGNRNPSPEEIKACSPYLLRQLEVLKPRVILALGTFAAQTLLQTSQPIGKLRGQVHRYYGVPLIVTYHPAALLRNPSWKRPTWEDVQLARRVFDSASGA